MNRCCAVAILFVAIAFPNSAFSASLTGEQLPAPAKEFLMDVLAAAGISSARVSSFERSARRQAELIHGAILRDGVQAAKKRYGSAGDAVIDVYVANKGKLETPDLLNAMTAKVKSEVSRLGPKRRQLMHIPPTSNYTFDVAPSSISNKSAFKSQLSKHPEVVRFFSPGEAESAFHIEVSKSLRTVAGTWNGTCSVDGETVGISLKLKRNSSGYVGNLEGDGDIFALSGIVVDRKTRKIRMTLNDDGEIVRFSGTIGNNNSLIRVSFTPGEGSCQWKK